MRIGRDGRLLYMNSVTENYTGIACDTARGKTLEQLSANGQNLCVSPEEVAQVLGTGQASVREDSFATVHGKRDFECRLVPELDHHRATKSVLAITRDITDQKRSE